MSIKDTFEMIAKISDGSNIEKAIQNINIHQLDEEGNSLLDHIVFQKNIGLLRFAVKQELLKFENGTIFENNQEYKNVDKLYDLMCEDGWKFLRNSKHRGNLHIQYIIGREKSLRDNKKWDYYISELTQFFTINEESISVLLYERHIKAFLKKNATKVLYLLLHENHLEKMNLLKSRLNNETYLEISDKWEDIVFKSTLGDKAFLEKVDLEEAFFKKDFKVIDAYIKEMNITIASQISQFQKNNYFDYNEELILHLFKLGVLPPTVTTSYCDIAIDTKYLNVLLQILYKMIIDKK